MRLDLLVVLSGTKHVGGDFSNETAVVVAADLISAHYRVDALGLIPFVDVLRLLRGSTKRLAGLSL